MHSTPPLFESVLALYTARIHELEPAKKNHFSLRAYSATGEKKYLSVIKEIILQKKKAIGERVVALQQPQLTFTPRPLQGTSVNALRNKKRQAYYSQHPLLPFFHDLTNDLFVLDRLGAATPTTPLLREGLTALSAHMDQAYLLCTKDAIQNVSSYSANVIYHLKRLGVTNLTQEYLKTLQSLLKKDFSHPDTLPDTDLYSLFYTLTHVIIAASDYYDHKPQEGFSFLFEYFEKHLVLIIRRLSIDIITEVALCYRLCNHNAEILKKLREYITQQFSLDASISSQILSAKEHTASLVLLLFSPLDTLVGGPYHSQS